MSLLWSSSITKNRLSTYVFNCVDENKNKQQIQELSLFPVLNIYGPPFSVPPWPKHTFYLAPWGGATICAVDFMRQ